MTVTITQHQLQEEEQSNSVSDGISSAAGRQEVMSLTYSDFIYPREQLAEPPPGSNSTVENGFEHIPSPPLSSSTSRLNLPHEFQVIDLDASVPLLQNMDENNEDFILICEFSELLGPIPLVTVPFNALEKTGINLNSLSVHVMFTDYQVNTVGQFKICDDTQVMRTNVFKDVHVFMQYFTLYDIKARGFVRPFCFGYVSKDRVKLEINLEKLIHLFNDITTILKCSNRVWFHGELKNYLNKLNNAKDNYPFIRSYSPPIPGGHGPGSDESNTFSLTLEGIMHHGTESYSSDTIDIDSFGDTISLQQIEHQFHEIENIFKIVDAVKPDKTIIAMLDKVKEFYNENSDKLLGQLLSRLNFLGNTFEQLRLPYVHPLKRKDEALRPLTVLGQFGVAIFLQKLFEVRKNFRLDLIFSEMTRLVDEFEQQNLEESSDAESDENENEIVEEAVEVNASMSTDSTNGSSVVMNESMDLSFIDLFNHVELCQVLEKLHFTCPVASKYIPDDSTSESFVTLSNNCSNSTTPTFNLSTNENGSSLYQTALGSVDSRWTARNDIGVEEGTIVFPSSLSSVLSNHQILLIGRQDEESTRLEPGPLQLLPYDLSNTSLLVDGNTPPTSSNVSFIDSTLTSTTINVPPIPASSDEDSSPIQTLKRDSTSNESGEGSIVEIEKKHWWSYAEKTKLTKRDPGHGLLKFFKHYQSVAHHLLYSILIGRPVIIFGKETMKSRILQIFNALIPFIPAYPEKTFKILQWHQGILIPAYYKSFKLIGLCLPERLTIHDLVSPHDLNFITLLDYEAKKISGPAYSGFYFEQFGSSSTFASSKFFDDLSLLTFIGSFLTEIQSQVFMCKVMLIEYYKKNNDSYNNFKSMSKIMKQLSLKNSDSEIVKHLSGILMSPHDCTELF